jgi:hypothetical protein
MDTMQLLSSQRNVPTFLGVYQFDLLFEHAITRPSTVIINTDPHTMSGSHWLEPKSYTAFYFDSYGLTSIVPDIHSFFETDACLGI